MQHQCNEQERAGGMGSDTESPQAALLSMLEAARVALVELSARVVFVELVDLVREALLQVEDLADYAEHGGEVTVIAMEAEDIAVALRNAPGHTRHDDHAWHCTVESLRKVAEHCRQRMGQGATSATPGRG
jgi:histone H3/H4